MNINYSHHAVHYILITFIFLYLEVFNLLIPLTHLLWASLVVQLVKSPPAMQETPVQFLGREDPLEKGQATHSSILAWRIPWTVYGVAKSWTQLSDFHFTKTCYHGFLLISVSLDYFFFFPYAHFHSVCVFRYEVNLLPAAYVQVWILYLFSHSVF